MRIIAGSKRGMKLLSPKSGSSRPVTDRVKESLFDVLFKYNMPNDKIVADLFCGVGSLGLEALSRGAVFVTFVEIDPKTVLILNRNIDKAGFVKESKVIRANAFKVGAPVGPEGQKYDLVFIDPPYAYTRDVDTGSQVDELLIFIWKQLAPKGMTVVRTHRRTFLLERHGELKVIDRRQWGSTAVTILRAEGQ
jgi:16S rRNA (guanine966-N2)-methyltransferase